MINLMMRNWRLYIRDRASVLYSLLGVFIIIGLYVLFLGNMVSQSVAMVPGGKQLADAWIMAGLVGVASFTTVLGALGTIVEDRDRKIDKDFQASPLGRWQIAGGYILSAVLVGFVMCCVTLALTQVYIVVRGGSLLTLWALSRMLGVMLLSSMTSAAILFPVVMTVRSSSAFGGVSTVAGTLIGFLTGMYIPIGEMPRAVQTVMKCFPTTHAVAMMRQIMTEAPMAKTFAGAPEMIMDSVTQNMGIYLKAGAQVIPTWGHVLVLVGTVCVMGGVSVLLVARQKKG